MKQTTLLALLLALPCLAFAERTLMDGGQARYAIVTAPSAAEPERFAAEELRRYLGLIGGGRFGDAPSGAPVIHVGGRSPEVDAALEGRREDSFVVLGSGADLYLTGNTPRATLY